MKPRLLTAAAVHPVGPALNHQPAEDQAHCSRSSSRRQDVTTGRRSGTSPLRSAWERPLETHCLLFPENSLRAPGRKGLWSQQSGWVAGLVAVRADLQLQASPRAPGGGSGSRVYGPMCCCPRASHGPAVNG